MKWPRREQYNPLDASRDFEFWLHSNRPCCEIHCEVLHNVRRLGGFVRTFRVHLGPNDIKTRPFGESPIPLPNGVRAAPQKVPIRSPIGSPNGSPIRSPVGWPIAWPTAVPIGYPFKFQKRSCIATRTGSPHWRQIWVPIWGPDCITHGVPHSPPRGFLRFWPPFHPTLPAP